MADPREAVVHEAATLSVRGIGAGVGVILAGIAIAVVVPAAIVALVQAPANAPDDASHPKIRPPVQELAPEDDMAAFRGGKMRRLESYGIDPRTGRAHVPIERAMQMLVERSKPSGAARPGWNHG